MFATNEIVISGATGICKIADIRKENFNSEPTEYYILKPVYSDNATFFLPTKNRTKASKMRHLITVEEIRDLVIASPEGEDECIDDDHLRFEKYTAIIKRCETQEIFWMLRSLHERKKTQLEAGKKFHTADDKLAKEAETLLYGEFAIALDILPEEVPAYIEETFGIEI